MKTCPWCEGRRVTGRIVPSEDGERLGRLPVLHVIDAACKVCRGTGKVSVQKHAALTQRRFARG